jgi:hypothetical protein
MTHITTNAIKLRAHAILDDVRAGIFHDLRAITWSLRILGDISNGL